MKTFLVIKIKSFSIKWTEIPYKWKLRLVSFTWTFSKHWWTLSCRQTNPVRPARLFSWFYPTRSITKASCLTWASCWTRTITWPACPQWTPPESLCPPCPMCSQCWYPRGQWPTPCAVTPWTSTWTTPSLLHTQHHPLLSELLETIQATAQVLSRLQPPLATVVGISTTTQLLRSSRSKMLE